MILCHMGPLSRSGGIWIWTKEDIHVPAIYTGKKGFYTRTIMHGLKCSGYQHLSCIEFIWMKPQALNSSAMIEKHLSCIELSKSCHVPTYQRPILPPLRSDRVHTAMATNEAVFNTEGLTTSPPTHTQTLYQRPILPPLRSDRVHTAMTTNEAKCSILRVWPPPHTHTQTLYQHPILPPLRSDRMRTAMATNETKCSILRVWPHFSCTSNWYSFTWKLWWKSDSATKCYRVCNV